MVFALLRKRAPDPVPGLYATIAAAARRPEHYLAHQVPDTVEGRFELLMLMTGLVVDRLNRAEDGATKEAGRRLGETFFDDMDRTLRELGVGDTTMPKKMKKIARAFFGRLVATRAALAAPDPAVLEQSLVRNVYQGTGDEAFERAATAAEPAPAAVAALAAHVRRLAAALAATPAEVILAGGFAFPEPDQTPTDARP